MMMTDFKQVQASVFQVARAPGKNIVYLGCLLLIVGIFAMLYVRERRLWVWLAKDGDDAARHGGDHGLLGQPQDHRQRPRIRAPEGQAARHQERHGVMTTTTLTLNDSWLSRRNAFDWVFAAAGAGGRALRLLALCRIDGLLREDDPRGGHAGGDLARLVLAAAARAGDRGRAARRCWPSRPTRATWRAPTRCSGSSTSCRASRPSSG